MMEFISNSVLHPNIKLLAVSQIAAKLLQPVNLAYLIRIHSALADGGLLPAKNTKGQIAKWESIKLWYFLRGVDAAGSGWAEFNLHQVAAFFERSVYTIRRWCRWGKSLKLFRAVHHLGNGFYRIHYTSLAKTALSQGLTELGGIAYVAQHELKTLRFAATETTTMQLQNQSRFNEARRKENKSKRIATPTEFVQSQLGVGSILFRRGRFTFLKFNSAYYGTAQSTVAEKLGRHPSTVQRRLSNSWREKRGIGTIAKTQLVTPPRTKLKPIKGSKYGVREIPLPQQHIIRVSEGVFRLGANVYDLPVVLSSGKAQRQALKRALQPSRFDDEWKYLPDYQALKEAWRDAANDKD